MASNLMIDGNGRSIQALATGLAEVLSSGAATSVSTSDSTVYLLSSVSDTYWAVIEGSLSTTITSSNGNYLKLGGYVYIPVPVGYKLKVDASGSATAGLCF